eukprot:TRINITY_DN8077_c0_g1_i2.p1 TRINITY_DN8077_c0_g1~~TRINITY_DN8077_c0_g1_i2.p1  ORF type:complete len:250 (+),score=33.25 TRINITY_DN8077_c0_g1_i2:439-1188(+)
MMRDERTAGDIKQCPSCKADVMKTGGCNAMTCSLCSTGFCWLCGEEIQDAEGLPIHFMRWNTASKCAGRQFEGMDGETDAFGAIELSGCERVIQINLIVLIFLILLPFLLLACIMGCISNCIVDLILRPCVDDAEVRLLWRTRCQYVFVFILLLPGLLASAVLWVPWFCYLRWKVQRLQQNMQEEDGFDPEIMQQVRQASVEEHERESERRSTDYGTLQNEYDEENPYVAPPNAQGTAPESQPLMTSTV